MKSSFVSKACKCALHRAATSLLTPKTSSIIRHGGPQLSTPFFNNHSTTAKQEARSTTSTTSTTTTTTASLFAGTSKDNSTRKGAEQDKTLLERIFYRNTDWKKESESQFSENIENVLLTQRPQATLLTCCDSRAPSAAIGLTEPNATFEIRNIGNQAINALGSIEFGLEVLKTPYLLVMGHTNCGAVMGALSDYRKLHSMIQRELLSLVKSVRFAEYVIGGDDTMAPGDVTAQDGKLFQKDDKDEQQEYFLKVNKLAEINVDFQIIQLLDDWKVKRAVNRGELNIVGLMFDIHNMYGKGHGQVHFINLNGKRDVDEIKHSSLFDGMTKEDKDTAIRRLFTYPVGFSYRDFAE